MTRKTLLGSASPTDPFVGKQINVVADTPADEVLSALRPDAAEIPFLIGRCVEHGSAAEGYADGGVQCLTCCQVETSCTCHWESLLPAASPALDYERLADDVRYGFVKSDYSRGFNDGIAAFIARLTEQEAADR